MNSVYSRVADLKPNLVIDLLLENDEDLNQYKIEYPLILQFKVAKIEKVISNLTVSLSVENNFKVLSKIG